MHVSQALFLSKELRITKILLFDGFKRRGNYLLSRNSRGGAGHVPADTGRDDGTRPRRRGQVLRCGPNIPLFPFTPDPGRLHHSTAA